ncbi:four helix bundle protein [Hymenobacter metallilatus]|uniref:Four helix bundle protein n=1 Tax=Hymenobacter metallilatus TaxID=2493666 RepID=A0A3R9M497_9BACT|nr:four helix bundle protein [Hymenobacter metallilatus]RSK36352.1 four helix bundle protein [Hymenobacter metallilatus]
MATITRFEELTAWQKARELTRRIYDCTRAGEFARDFGLRDQIRRASGSVMDNIAEGFDRGGRGEFVQFLGIAKGSAGEVRSQLYRAFDQQYLTQTEFDELRELSEEIGRLIEGLLKYLSTSTVRGERYQQPTHHSATAQPE